METFTGVKSLVNNPDFDEQRRRCLAAFDLGAIDAPLRDIIEAFTRLACCYTLQCCWGHFLPGGAGDAHTLALLPASPAADSVRYRIAYLALCVENTAAGRGLLSDLGGIVALEPDCIQLGCAEWFWDRVVVNSYALQVEPVRYQNRDEVMLSHPEALHVQAVRDEFFAAVREILRCWSVL
ncbi:MAG: hypothetical protein ABFD81_00445 [Syntrophaceae bacterium]